MVKILPLLIFGGLVSGSVGVVFLPFPKRPPMKPCAAQYSEGYERAAIDIKIFASGTGQLPSPEWSKRAAEYRLDKTENQDEGIALGLLPDPKTTLQPIPQ